MLQNNSRRVDYYERYMTIYDYNTEQDRGTIEKTFMDLVVLANSMTKEKQHYVQEDFSSDEELSMYDMLFKNYLSKEDIKEIKKIAVRLPKKQG